jgi:DNA repair protein RadD
MPIQPRDYQAAAVQSIFDYFISKHGNPVVAMPTGTGKSVVIALFLQRVFYHYPRQRVMVLTHVKELIGQNFAKLLEAWPTAPAGIYSSGLKRRDTREKIIMALQSAQRSSGTLTSSWWTRRT